MNGYNVKMADKNKVRTSIRTNTVTNSVVLSSFQSCKLKDNLDILERKILNVSPGYRLWEHLRGLRAILDCLLADITCVNGSSRVKSYMDFDEAYHLYLSYCTYGEASVKDCDQKKRFKELLLHPEFGLCVYIVSLKGKKYIILRADETDLDDFFLHLSTNVNTCEKTSRFILDRDTVRALSMALDTEWDKKVLRVVLGATRSRAELDDLGIDSDSICKDEQCVFDYLKQIEEIEQEANTAVENEINNRIEKKQGILHSKERLVSCKESFWSDTQILEENENIENLRSSIDSLKKLKEEHGSISKKHMINRCNKNIIKDRRLKLRRLGSGRKPGMDEIDEQFLVQSITEKATAHGRRHDSVMNLNHRVKKSDFSRIVNYSRLQRALPPMRSVTAVHNRSRPKNKRSMQAKRHCGLGLFCCKKPPKAENNSGILTHYCRAQKKNMIRYLCDHFQNKNSTLYRSFDDKAYLCPGTSTGMRSSRSQKIYQAVNPELAPKLPKYDFPEHMVNCTPGTFLFMNKEMQVVDNEECIKTSDQQTVVVTKPKHFVGSSGTVWASHLMDIKHLEPNLYEAESPLDWQSKPFRSVMATLYDNLLYFNYQFDDDDLEVSKGDQDGIFQEYEMKKVQTFKERMHEFQAQVADESNSWCNKEKTALEIILTKLSAPQDSIEDYRNNLGDTFVSDSEMKACINECMNLLRDVKLPKIKSRVIDLTDAGPGVGISNHEVKIRTAEEIRLMNYDYYVR